MNQAVEQPPQSRVNLLTYGQPPLLDFSAPVLTDGNNVFVTLEPIMNGQHTSHLVQTTLSRVPNTASNIDHLLHIPTLVESTGHMTPPVLNGISIMLNTLLMCGARTCPRRCTDTGTSCSKARPKPQLPAWWFHAPKTHRCKLHPPMPVNAKQKNNEN